VTIILDPDNQIVESNEMDNFYEIPGGLKSSNGWIDQATETLGSWSVPAIIMLLTISLLGVAGFVMVGRRREALARVAEQSSLVATEDMF
jgi:hypothetical protein